jgi:GNAT superfamily N-acetyltransferase
MIGASDVPLPPGTDRPIRFPYSVRATASAQDRAAAASLVRQRYETRGYRTVEHADPPRPECELTLVADNGGRPVGTLTVAFDNPVGLKIDELFSIEANALRATGKRLCEFTRLALEQIERSHVVLRALFETAYEYSYKVMGFDRLLIEVNPRHVRYYERMYGFEILAGMRHNDRVNAPAVLLGVDLALVAQHAARN